MFGFLKRLITSKTRSSKVIRNKNGSTSTFTKTKSNGKTKWTKTGGSKWKGSKPKSSSTRRKKR